MIGQLRFPVGARSEPGDVCGELLPPAGLDVYPLQEPAELHRPSGELPPGHRRPGEVRGEVPSPPDPDDPSVDGLAPGACQRGDGEDASREEITTAHVHDRSLRSSGGEVRPAATARTTGTVRT